MCDEPPIFAEDQMHGAGQVAARCLFHHPMHVNVVPNRAEKLSILLNREVYGDDRYFCGRLLYATSPGEARWNLSFRNGELEPFQVRRIVVGWCFPNPGWDPGIKTDVPPALEHEINTWKRIDPAGKQFVADILGAQNLGLPFGSKPGVFVCP